MAVHAGGERCEHAFCVSCIQQYFSDDTHQPARCPVCGVLDNHHQQQQQQAATQPDDGVMMVTYDNAFRLPGYETTSRGTIVVCYSFPPGTQKATNYSQFSSLSVLPVVKIN